VRVRVCVWSTLIQNTGVNPSASHDSIPIPEVSIQYFSCTNLLQRKIILVFFNIFRENWTN